MSARLAAWIVAALALIVVLQILVPGVVVVALFTLAVPIAVVAKLLALRRAENDRDTAEALVSAAAALTGDRTPSNGAQVDWGAALRAELASITVPRERLRFAF